MVDENRKLIGWKVWYGDGTVLTSEFNKWIDIPQKNMQIQKLFYKGKNGIEVNVHKNQEYYLLNDLLQIPMSMKIGKSIDPDEFYDMLEEAEKESKIIEEMI